MRCLLAGLFVLLWIVAAAAQTPAVLDLAALPSMEPAGRTGYEQRFLLGNLQRAWAISSNGKYGGQWGSDTIASVRAAALKSCAEKAVRTARSMPRTSTWSGAVARRRRARPCPGR